MPSSSSRASGANVQTRDREVGGRLRKKLVHRRDLPRRQPKPQSTLTQLNYVSTLHHERLPDTNDDYNETGSRKRRKCKGGTSTTKDKCRNTLTQIWGTKQHVEIPDSEESDGDTDLQDDSDRTQPESCYQYPQAEPIPRSHTSTSSSPTLCRPQVSEERLLVDESWRRTSSPAPSPSHLSALQSFCQYKARPPKILAKLGFPEPLDKGRSFRRTALEEIDGNTVKVGEERVSITPRRKDVGARGENAYDEEARDAFSGSAKKAWTHQRHTPVMEELMRYTATVEDSDPDDDADFEDTPFPDHWGQFLASTLQDTPPVKPKWTFPSTHAVSDDCMKSAKGDNAQPITGVVCSLIGPSNILDDEPVQSSSLLTAQSTLQSKRLAAARQPIASTTRIDNSFWGALNQLEATDTTCFRRGQPLKKAEQTYVRHSLNGSCEEESQENTFDPLTAALERDAARFGKTETQLDKDDSRKRLLDRACLDDETSEPETIVEVALSTQRAPCPDYHLEPVSAGTQRKSAISRSEAATGDITLNRGSSVENQDLVGIPSSQPSERIPIPRIRPPSNTTAVPLSIASQNRTVDELQNSAKESRFVHSEHTQDIEHSYQVAYTAEERADETLPPISGDLGSMPGRPASTQSTMSPWSNPIISSPLCAASSDCSTNLATTCESMTQNSWLVDFSLPPHPPLYPSQS